MKPIDFFSEYMRVTGVPTLNAPVASDPRLQGKRLGVVNGANWITLFSDWFGHRLLPGVKIINVGNEAVQLNFMQAHADGLEVPPQANIDCFCRYASDLCNLAKADAVMISCSTMNRAIERVRHTLEPFGVPAFTIDSAMMEQALDCGERILIIATHGPTVRSTRLLLEETAASRGFDVQAEGITIEEAFAMLGRGDIEGHNHLIADAIRHAADSFRPDAVVLAQLSMAVFSLSYPDPVATFGIPVLNSAECGFNHARRILSGLNS